MEDVATEADMDLTGKRNEDDYEMEDEFEDTAAVTKTEEEEDFFSCLTMR
jgi:hypothetical protein